MASGKSIYNKQSKPCYKIAIIFVFLYEIYFLLAHFCFKCNLKNPEWYLIKQERAIYCEWFSLKIGNINLVTRE